MTKGHPKRRTLVKVALITLVMLVSPFSGRAATNYVFMDGIRFSPADITISPGDTVIWSGNGTIHTVTGTGGDPLCGGTWIYSSTKCIKTFTTAGTFTYACQVHQNYGMTGVVRVLATNTPPTTALTQPVTGSVFATDQSFNLVATARDTNGSVTLVQFFDGTTLLGTVTNTSAITNNTYRLLVSNFTAGGHVLKSVATDNLSATGTSPTTATISVVMPILSSLTAATFVNGQYTLSYSADVGLSYVLDASTNLVDWVSLATNKAESTTVNFTDTNSSTFGVRFYRSVRIK